MHIFTSHACTHCTDCWLESHQFRCTIVSSRRPPAIYSVSSDQTLSILSGHENVVLMCTAIGHITGGYWEKVDGKVSLNHNKSKLILHNHKKATVNMTITRVHPIHSGKYRCVIFNQWGVVKSKDVQVTVKSKGGHI